ncbi:MotA/TolQ/ExbB proton channel family protein [Telmatospirillum siberiense]|nr:MotA/TolQ/ExbB proton channel family protein [Telmatospirillum siberiense]
MTTAYLLHLATESGGILYIMAFLLTVALGVIIERSWFLGRLIRKGDMLLGELSRLRHLDPSAIRELKDRAVDDPHGEILAVPLDFPEISDPHRLSELLEEAILAQAPHIDRRMWMLDTIVTLAPLLGLLGTIIGMFNSFEVLGKPGSAPTEITSGIAEALVATACGLFIAIVGLVFFNGLNNAVRLVIHQLDRIKVTLVNRMDAPRHAVQAHASVASAPLHGLTTAAAKG